MENVQQQQRSLWHKHTVLRTITKSITAFHLVQFIYFVGFPSVDQKHNFLVLCTKIHTKNCVLVYVCWCVCVCVLVYGLCDWIPFICDQMNAVQYFHSTLWLNVKYMLVCVFLWHNFNAFNIYNQKGVFLVYNSPDNMQLKWKKNYSIVFERYFAPK